MKLAFFELESWQTKYIKGKLKNYKIKFIDGELNNQNVSKIKDVEGLGVFIYSEIDKIILSKLPNLQFIVTMSTGFDHIDVKECRNLGIKVSNVPSYGENTVAEHAVGLMLALSKNLVPAVKRTRKGDFDIEGLEGFDMKGRTLGVIGCGSIGKHVVQIAHAMDMKILVFSRTEDKNMCNILGFKYTTLNDLLKKSDIITLHVPLTPKTKHMINMKNIGKVKKGAYIINTARGGLIETKALLYGLNKEILHGAALDVLEGEDEMKEERYLSKKKLSKSEKELIRENNLLLKDKDVLITPHIAFYTREALMRILDVTISNVISNGKKNSVV